MKQINLEEILSKFENEEDLNTAILKAMRAACEATVDLCAENAKLVECDPCEFYINKGSILKTKKQIV